MGRRVGGGRGGAGVGGRGGGSPRWKVAPQCGWVPCVVKSHTRSGTAWGAHTERRLGCTASDCGRRLRGRLREASRATLRGARGPSSALGAQRAAVRTREGALGRGWPAKKGGCLGAWVAGSAAASQEMEGVFEPARPPPPRTPPTLRGGHSPPAASSRGPRACNRMHQACMGSSAHAVHVQGTCSSHLMCMCSAQGTCVVHVQREELA